MDDTLRRINKLQAELDLFNHKQAIGDPIMEVTNKDLYDAITEIKAVLADLVDRVHNLKTAPASSGGGSGDGDRIRREEVLIKHDWETVPMKRGGTRDVYRVTFAKNFDGKPLTRDVAFKTDKKKYISKDEQARIDALQKYSAGDNVVYWEVKENGFHNVVEVE